ncbi:hypothetical protein FHX33_001923 [Leifsonia aquatica]|uniref:Uncharacterized protein n=1 Tax=Leifsonia aquatica TaxID=144185 RepID=A0A7W4YIM3_LEIAQ|nr:hypothetical protein [Leifsonia aquatica]
MDALANRSAIEDSAYNECSRIAALHTKAPAHRARAFVW